MDRIPRSDRSRTALRAAALSFLVCAAPFAGWAQPAGATGGESSAIDRFVANELAAARKIDLYLVLTRDGRSVEVRSRGMVLDTVRLEATTVLRYRAARDAAPPPELPEIWEVRQEPAAEHRKLIAPDELRPYNEDDAAVAPQPPGILPEPPSSYEVGLDGGWVLRVTQQLPAGTLWARWRQTVADGWQRLRQHRIERPPVVVLTAPVEAGRRLHQLFRQGRKILIDPSTPPPPEPAAGSPDAAPAGATAGD
jgi:hypothetical protein